jgi:hypothetical protein
VLSGLEVRLENHHDWRHMSRLPIHEPPPPPVVAALVRAGLSLGTATAMEPWKASEVLELLRTTVRADALMGPAAPSRGTI